MRFLLDTHLVLWVPILDRRLSASARSILTAAGNEFVFSTASIWEIAIKRGLGKPNLQLNPRAIRRELLENGYEELPVLGHHAVAVDALPPIHKDPFDRLLIAQSMIEGITLLTADATIAKYPAPIRKV
jgi:PIN domain nuclease of toxin-antitoxin system